MLLTLEEYKALSCEWDQTQGVEDKQLTKLLKKAENTFKRETYHRYLTHDKAPTWLQETVKDSLVAIVDHWVNNGSTLTSGIGAPTSLNIGKTSLSFGGNKEETNGTNLPPEFYQTLKDTGLLYKGVGTW